MFSRQAGGGGAVVQQQQLAQEYLSPVRTRQQLQGQSVQQGPYQPSPQLQQHRVAPQSHPQYTQQQHAATPRRADYGPPPPTQQGYNSVEQAISQSLPPGSLPRQAPAPQQYRTQPAPSSAPSPSPHQRQFSQPQPSTSHHPYQQQQQQLQYEYLDNGVLVDREGRAITASASRSVVAGQGVERGGTQMLQHEQDGGDYDEREQRPPPQHQHQQQQFVAHQPQRASTLHPAPTPTAEPDSRPIFHSYLLDYLQKSGYSRAAHAFLLEVPETPIQPLQPGQVHPAAARSKGKGRAQASPRDAEAFGGRQGGVGGEFLSSPNEVSPREHLGQRPRSGAGDGNRGESTSSTNSSMTHFGFTPSGERGLGGGDEGDSPSPDFRSLPKANVQVETPQGFLYEWWTVFWDVFCVKAGNGGTVSARTFLEASSQAVELGLGRNPNLGAAQIYQRTVQQGQPPSHAGPPLRGPSSEGVYASPQHHQRQPPSAPMGPRPPGTMYRQATHPAQVQRAQEMAHAAAQQATMRVNGTGSAAPRQVVVGPRGVMSAAPSQGGPSLSQAQHDQELARRQYAAQQEQVHRQQQAAAQAQLGVRRQQQQQQAHQAAAMAHAQAAQMAQARRTPANGHRPPANQPSPYAQDGGYPSSPAKRFQMVNGGRAEAQQSNSNSGSPYQNGVAYGSPSQHADSYGSGRQGSTISQAQALSYALGDPVREQHARMGSNPYSQSPSGSASSPAYHHQQQQQGHSNSHTPHSSSRPPSGGPTPQQMDAATVMMEQQAARQAQQQAMEDGSMPPPPPNAYGVNVRPMINRTMSQATSNAGTPQAGTPSAAPSPSLQPPTPKGASAMSPAAASGGKRKREAKDTRETKKRAVSTRKRSDSTASNATANAATPSPAGHLVSPADAPPIPSGTPDSFTQSPSSTLFDPTALDPSDAILLSIPNGDLSVSGFGGEEDGLGFSKEQLDTLFNSSVASGGSAVPDNGSFDIDQFFNTGYGAEPNESDSFAYLNTDEFDLAV